MIEIDRLCRSYGEVKAVNHVSFNIDKGEIVGLLGHNGAGKTTIMKMITGFLQPDSGLVKIDGIDLAEDANAIKQRIGYLPENLPLYPEMQVADYLNYAAQLKGLSEGDAQYAIRQAIQDTDLGDKLLSKISTLSRGYKQRVGVAQALLGNPKVLILDEPTNGLDPSQTQQMRELIKRLAQSATVILSTHIMQEVDAICDRALILSQGALVVDAKLSELRQAGRILLKSDLGLTAAQSLIGTLEGVNQVEMHDDEIAISLGDTADINSLSDAIAKAVIQGDHSLFGLTQEQRDLETVFREVNRHA